MANKTVTVGPGKTYASLNAALAGEDDINADLVTNTMILTFDCYAFNDTTNATTGTGYTTSALYYLNITCPVGERHAGVWDGDKYNLVGGSKNNVLTLVEHYTRVSYLQLGTTDLSDLSNLIFFTSYYGVHIVDCLGRCINASRGASFGFACSDAPGTASNFIINCVVENVGSPAFYLRSSAAADRSYIYNCTAYNCAIGFRARGDYCQIKNALAIGCTDAYLESSEFEVADYCGFDEGADPGTHGLDLTAVADADIFTNVAGHDFSLVAARVGLNLYNDAAYPFQTDIKGVDRGGSGAVWDIGADEYVAAGIKIPVARHHYQQAGGL